MDNVNECNSKSGEQNVILATISLKKQFGDNLVLKGIDLEVAQGECVVIIGSSGSGKSTFLRCLNMLDPPTSGKVVFLGNDFDEKSKQINDFRRQIGIVFQSFNLFANKTVLKNLTLAPLLHGKKKMSKKDVEQKAKDLLNRFGLLDKAYMYPSSLSGGQKQRVAIARAMMCEPKILLFDEPTSALDPEMVREVVDCLVELKNDGITMVVVTHEMRFAAKVASRVVFFDKGIIAEEGDPRQIFDNPKTERLQEFLSQMLTL